MGQGILCRNQPDTSQVHSSTHKVHVCCRWVDRAGFCCSESEITSKHSSRDSPRGVRVLEHGGQGDSLAGSAAPWHPSHLPALLSSTEAPSECQEMAPKCFLIHHPTMSQLPILVLLVGVIHLPAHAQLSPKQGRVVPSCLQASPSDISAERGR